MRNDLKPQKPNSVKLKNKPPKPVLSPEDRKLKKMVIRACVLFAFTVIVFILIIALFIASLIDKTTPQIVYFIGGMILTGVVVVLCAVWSWYSKKTKLVLGIVGDGKSTVAMARKAVDDNSIKDKVYKILTCIGLVGDAILIVGVVFLMRAAKIPVEATVISVLLGALIAVVFHVAATVRYFRRKSKAQKYPQYTNLNGKGK